MCKCRKMAMSNEFKTEQDYWKFEHFVKCQYRYIRDSNIEEFLSTVLATAKDRETSVPAGTVFWRSQLSNELIPYYQDGECIYVPCPFPAKRMTPIKYVASEGRVNPKGIPYLYLADDKETAMSESRPWVGSYISVGQFKTLSSLQLIDCSRNPRILISFLEETDPQKLEQIIWSHIDSAFSQPVNINDNIAEYIPTQIIAELFKNASFDGIFYKSALGKGHNVALFDIGSAEIINCFLYEAKAVLFTFEDAGNPYFLRKTQS